MGHRRKFIIDTDTGVDDAMALLMALESHKAKQIEILAITSVTGNCSSHHAELNILRVLDAVGCPKIPVYGGAKEALVVPFLKHEHYHGKDGFNDVSFDSSPDRARIHKELAWNVINSLTSQFPGEITLVAVGPLTNVALAMKADPELPARIKEIYIMGGNKEGIGNITQAGEFNFVADPEAAYTVLRLTACPTYIAPWELSYKYNHVELSWRKEILGALDTPAAKLINKLEQVWFDNWPWGDNWILCDQLAMVAALDKESIHTSTKHKATVELGGRITRGMMILDQRVGALEGKLVESIGDETSGGANVIVIDKLHVHILKKYLHRAFAQSHLPCMEI